MKTCTKCKTEKPLDEFGKLKSSKDGKQYYCKECRKKYIINNKEKINKYRQNNKEKITIQTRRYSKKWYKENKETRNKKHIKYIKNRYKKNDLYKMTCNLRSRTSNAFRVSKWSKTSSNVEMLGCSYEKAFKHIENQFTDGMSWDNHSFYGWHIDHIIPLASAKTEEELKSLCHYTNLQPLWAEENLSKGAKVIY